jgi:hypothetical protein
MGKLFVTLFALASGHKTILYCLLHLDTRISTQLKSCTLTNFWLRSTLYRDTRIAHKTCTCTAKSAPPSRSASSGHSMLRLLRPQKNPNPNRGYYSPAFIRTDAPSGRSVPSAQQRLRTLLPGR